MARKTARALSIDESILLKDLRKLGFPARKSDVVEALEQLECVYDMETQRFYLPREFQTMREGQVLITASPDKGEVVVVGKEHVFHLVASYLLSGLSDEKGVVYAPNADGKSEIEVARENRFLPDPSEPTTDLEELAKEETRMKALAQERSEKIGSAVRAVDAYDTLAAQHAVLEYFSLLEQQLPGLAIPVHGDADEKRSYIEKLFVEVVPARGSSSIAGYLQDLQRIALQGVPEVTRAFVELAPTLYRQLSGDDAHSFVEQGLVILQPGKDDSTKEGKQKRQEALEEAFEYFSLQSESANNVITTRTLAEHGWLVPAYAILKQDLGRAEQAQESLRKALEEKLRKNIELGVEKEDLQFKLKIEKEIVVAANARADDMARRHAELDRRYTQDAAALEQERYKSAQLEALERGKDTAYQTATQRARTLEGELAAVKATLVDTKTNFDRYKTETGKILRKTGKITGLTGLAVGALCALVATSYDFSSKAPTPSKPVPAATTSAVPVPASGYDPQGRNLKQLERDFYKFINQPRPAGEELPKFGPGCQNVLGQVYDKMKGTPEGKNYFMNSMAASDFCNKIPEKGLVKLGEKK